MTTIKIATSTGDREVEAHVVGAWAVHRSWKFRALWSVTHATSGRCVGTMYDERQARAIVDALHEEIGDPYPHSLPRDEQTIEMTPELKHTAKRIINVVERTLRGSYD